MANAMFDMDIGVPWLYPYIGVGAGYPVDQPAQCAVVSTASSRCSAMRPTTAGCLRLAGDSRAVVPDAEHAGSFADQRISLPAATGGEKFAGTGLAGAGAVPAGIKLGNQNNHSFLFGVRYAFNVAAPTPVARPRRLLRRPRRRAPTWCSSIGTRRR